MTALPARFGRALLTAILATAVAIALAAPAGALPRTTTAAATPEAAAARAADLRTKVDKLTTAAQVASEDYANSQAQVADVMTRHLLAQRELTAAKASSADDTTIADNRVRAIYMTGGKAGLLSSVLGAHDLGDLTARLHTMNSLVGSDHTRVLTGFEATSQAAAIESQLAALSAQKLDLDNKSQQAAERVRVALRTTQQLLAAADATVQRLAEEQRAAAAAAAAAAFAAQLNAARSGTALGNLGTGTAPNAVAAAAVAAARTRLGLPYVWGATGPSSFDCSGLTGWAYRQAGLSLPRTSRQQWYAGARVGLAQLAPGDLLFWATNVADPASIHHEGMYLGGGLMVVAPKAGDVVKIQAVYSNGYIGAVRPTS